MTEMDNYVLDTEPTVSPSRLGRAIAYSTGTALVLAAACAAYTFHLDGDTHSLSGAVIYGIGGLAAYTTPIIIKGIDRLQKESKPSDNPDGWI